MSLSSYALELLPVVFAVAGKSLLEQDVVDVLIATSSSSVDLGLGDTPLLDDLHKTLERGLVGGVVDAGDDTALWELLLLSPLLHRRQRSSWCANNYSAYSGGIIWVRRFSGFY